MARLVDQSSCLLSPPSQWWVYRYVPPLCLHFYVGSRDPNLHPCVCATTLLTESSPQPVTYSVSHPPQDPWVLPTPIPGTASPYFSSPDGALNSYVPTRLQAHSSGTKTEATGGKIFWDLIPSSASLFPGPWTGDKLVSAL